MDQVGTVQPIGLNFYNNKLILGSYNYKVFKVMSEALSQTFCWLKIPSKSQISDHLVQTIPIMSKWSVSLDSINFINNTSIKI